ncbi:HAD domain-containing protein [Glutamicibacter sp. TV12E]|uniref:HAD domain-containing protein n=1 Tax=Glutamicibacter sp. TV12E TaxID=3446362 RepID=UPI0040345B17
MTNYLFLDIDGVLNAVGALLDDVRNHQAWPDYELVTGERWGETVSPQMITELNHILNSHEVQLVWLTTWERAAPAFGHKIGIDRALDAPWLSVEDAHGEWGKLVSVRAFLTQHHKRGDKAAWFDDDLASEHDAALWAARQGILAIPPAARHGITPAHLHQLSGHYTR